MWYTHTKEYYSGRKEILTLVTTWMSLEDIILSKPVTKDKYRMIPLI